MSDEQETLWDYSGETYDPERDKDRLNAQMRRVLSVVADGQWHTLAGIAAVTGDPEASVSARLRDLRKWRFGSHTIERQYAGDGLWEYRMNDKKEE